MFVAALTARIIVGDWQITDALVPLVMIALFPFFEWIIDVFILHRRPKHLSRLTIDPLLAREHRAHYVDPRNIPLIFIPAKALLGTYPDPAGRCHVTDREEPARYYWTMIGSPMFTVL